MVGAGLAKGAGWLGKKLFGFGKTALKETSSLVETAGTDIAAIAPELEAGAAVVAEETAGAAMSPFTGGASLIATTALAAGTWEALRGGKDLKKIGKFFYDSKGNKVDKNGKPIGGDDTSNSSNVSTNGSRPLAGNPQITSGFGIVRNLLNAKGLKTASYGKPHGGVDFGVGEGTPIYAVKDGDVSPITSDPNGFGNYVSINHPDGKTSFYGHMSKVAATPGGKVKAGDVVGYSGNSGNSTGPHLHFEVRDGATKIDPLAYISGANSTPDSSGGATAHPLYGGLKLSGGSSGLSLPAGGEGDVGTPVYGIKGMHQNSNGVAINYGGVNITMNFPQGNYDTQKIKDAVRDVISYDNIRKHAVSK
jgi:murein DD-endopeptidase MepM/ murein hydrolase activator NlpD